MQDGLGLAVFLVLDGAPPLLGDVAPRRQPGAAALAAAVALLLGQLVALLPLALPLRLAQLPLDLKPAA